jgi:hypothetical protein
MHTEFGFLFGAAGVGSKVGDGDPKGRDRKDIYNRLPDNLVIFYKSNQKNSSSEAKNSIKESLYNIEGDKDPYIQLLEDYNGEKEEIRPLTIKAADFAYLTDLGVYPLNRLVILRRFPEGSVVPGNLSEWGKNGPEPIATVIGWVKEGTDDLFSIGFNEVWSRQTETLDKVFNHIFKEEFSHKLENVMSVPGWSQGFLWGFLNKMGMANEAYSFNNVPQGDPNVLKTSLMRDIYQQGLETTFNMTVNTEYEQKFINGVDPSKAMLDIIDNLTRFGTSEMSYYLKPDSKMMKNLIKAINSSGNKSNLDNWVAFIKTLFEAFFVGIQATITDLKQFFDKPKETPTTTTNGNPSNESTTNESTTGDSSKKPQDELKPIETASNLLNVGREIYNFFGNTLLAGTINKYRWPIRGSLSLMTGLPSTPWHMTIGNPYHPVISLNNVQVDGVTITPNTEMGFGDMPTRLKVSITLKIGRPLGKQEIDRIFNNNYRRVYTKATIEDVKLIQTVTETSTTNTGSGVDDIKKENNIKRQNIETGVPFKLPERQYPTISSGMNF